MLLQITTSAWVDFLSQLSGLASDPVCRGKGVPHGDGQPVLLIPGFTAGDWSLRPMARWLARVGYRPFLSGIDLNVGCPQRKVELVGWRLEQIVEETGAPVVIIGHSLGGVLGRAVGSLYPERVRRVIALGSPLRMHWDVVRDEVRPAMLAMQGFWQSVRRAPRDCGTHLCGCGFADYVQDRHASIRNFDSIFTRDDEVVDWRECVGDGVAAHEVSGRHAGLIVNKEVYCLVASILAQDAPTVA